MRPVRGTRDLIGEDLRRHRHVVETARRIAQLYGFDEWATPIFEETGVFARTLGDTSDVVSKEMYTFEDRGGDSLTLRPEGTAGVCRALVSNGLAQSLPQKVFYSGPMFRYERPQKGRYRQFHQIGLELLGSSEPVADAEIIACGGHILAALGLSSKTVLHVNTLGDFESRKAYRSALIELFNEHRDALSADSSLRLTKNPLRILDSKDPADRAIVALAPSIEQFLTPSSKMFFDNLRNRLERFGVDFVYDPFIVRGLDYYNDTVFEFVTDSIGAQSTVLAGGRYNNLVTQMGGPTFHGGITGVGWAAGIDRLSLLIANLAAEPAPVAVVPVGDAAERAAIVVLQQLRAAGVRAEMAYRGNLKKRMERANKIGASFAVILGDEEATLGVAKVKDLSSGTQQELALADIALAGPWCISQH